MTNWFVQMLNGVVSTNVIFSVSETFAEALRKAGVQAKLVLCKGKTHTDLFIQVDGFYIWGFIYMEYKHDVL